MAGSGNYRILVGVDGSAESRAATDPARSPGLMLGSVSTQAVHHAHCPVLVFREQG